MLSPRRTAKLWFVVGGLLVLLAATAILSLMIGAKAIAPDVILSALLAPDLTQPDHAVVWDGRIPRTALGLTAGAAIGAAGALIQGLTRNPLADPGVLGINSGAAFCVVAAVAVFRIENPWGYIWFAFLGAFLAALAVYRIGGSKRGADPARLVLAGVALSAVLDGIGRGLSQVDPQAWDRIRVWNTGSLAIGSLAPVTVMGLFVVVGLALAAVSGRGLNALALGEETASALGADVRRTRLITVTAITLLAGASAATAGVLIFLGLMVPHLARRIAGPDNRWVIGLSTLIAPIVLLLADVIGRVILRGELAAGIVVAFVGAPFLIAIARRRRVIEL